MRDVGGVVRGLVLAELLALLMALLAGRLLRCEPERRGRAMLAAAAGIGVAAVVMGAFFALAFDTAFAAFHAIFFAAGTWQFGPDSNLLRFFPQPFWFELALVGGRDHRARARCSPRCLLAAICDRAPEAPERRAAEARLHSDGGQRIVRASAASPASGSRCTRPG